MPVGKTGYLPLQNIVANLKREGVLGLAERVCAERGLPFETVWGGARGSARMAAARHETWSLISGTLGLSLVEIATIFGVDHSTVLWGLRRREGVLARDCPGPRDLAEEDRRAAG